MSAAVATREVPGDVALAVLAVRGVAAVVVFLTAQAGSNHSGQFGRLAGVEHLGSFGPGFGFEVDDSAGDTLRRLRADASRPPASRPRCVARWAAFYVTV